MSVDAVAQAHELLAQNRYVVIATSDADGRPWATPVWFAPDRLDRVVWLSSYDARHSVLIAANPHVALVVYDSSRPSSEAAAFYAVGRADECPKDGLDEALILLNERSEQQGLRRFGRVDVTGEARLRVFTATIDEAWILDQEAPIDRRIAVPRPAGG